MTKNHKDYFFPIKPMFEKMLEKETVCARIKEFILSVQYSMGNLNFIACWSINAQRSKGNAFSMSGFFVIPWTVTCQVRLSMGIFEARIQAWSIHSLLQPDLPDNCD